MIIQVQPGSGWIEVVAGCMYSGKTEELVRRLRRTTYAKQTVIAFKPVIDDRYHAEDLATHLGDTFKAIPVHTAHEILDKVGDAEVVGIDEAQFFGPEIAEVATTLAGMGKRVIVSGLDADYEGKPFKAVAHLMAVAEFVDKIQAVCVICGFPATKSQRISDSGDRVLVGSEGVYEARCRRHWSPQPVLSAARMRDMVED